MWDCRYSTENSPHSDQTWEYPEILLIPHNIVLDLNNVICAIMCN